MNEVSNRRGKDASMGHQDISPISKGEMRRQRRVKPLLALVASTDE